MTSNGVLTSPLLNHCVLVQWLSDRALMSVMLHQDRDKTRREDGRADIGPASFLAMHKYSNVSFSQLVMSISAHFLKQQVFIIPQTHNSVLYNTYLLQLC